MITRFELKSIASLKYEQLFDGAWYSRNRGIIIRDCTNIYFSTRYVKPEYYNIACIGQVCGVERQKNILIVRTRAPKTKYFTVRFMFDSGIRNHVNNIQECYIIEPKITLVDILYETLRHDFVNTIRDKYLLLRKMLTRDILSNCIKLMTNVRFHAI